MANPITPLYHLGKNVLGGGKSALSSLGNWYNEPYDEAVDANLAAGDESRKLGVEGATAIGGGINRALDQTLPAARFWNRTYEGEGELAKPGALEQLYTERKNGTDLNAENQRRLGERSINNNFAARGLQNSGAALSALGDMNTSIDAEHYKQMGDLAAASQGATERRLGGGFDRLAGLGESRAGTVTGGIQGAVDTYTAGQLGGVNAALNAANVNLTKRKDLLGLGGTIGGGLAGLAG
jgi:hypothetical protein